MLAKGVLMQTLRKSEMNDVEEALEVINRAALRSREEIRDMIQADYKQLQKTLQEINPEVKTALGTINTAAKQKLIKTTEDANQYAKHRAMEFDATVRENSWKVIIGAILTGGFLGYLMGRRS